MEGCVVTAGQGASVAGSKVRGTIYVSGALSVVSNCLVWGNNIGGSAKNNHGGGVYMEGGLVVGCVISNNVAGIQGGGVHLTGGTLRNCLVAGNTIDNSSGSSGGGVYQTGGSVENCTVVGNVATISGGGLYQTAGTAVNSIFYFNEGGDVVSSGSISYCGMYPLVGGEGNTASEPTFMDASAGDWRFTSLARDYIDKGVGLPWMEGAVDLSGNGRVAGAGPDIGAIEYYPSADEPFIVNFTTEVTSGGAPLHCAFTANITKYDLADCTFVWNFGDGSALETVVGSPVAQHEYVAAGAFTVTLTVVPPSGAADAPAVMPREGYVTIIPDVCYVSPAGANVFPYHTWETAANNLPDAVAVGSAKVVVTNGTYSFNGVTLARPVEVVSVEGPEKTILRSSAGNYNLMTLKDESVRLAGFTLRDANITDWNISTGGSGLRVEAGVASNCIVRNCHKYSYGNTFVGGTGRLLDSRLINNTCGAVNSIGSALFVTGEGYVSGCVVTNNTSEGRSDDVVNGGLGLNMDGGTVVGCVFADNRFNQAGSRAAGANIRGGLVDRCVFSNNLSRALAGGVCLSAGTLRNSLIARNRCTGAATGDGVGGLYLRGGVAESLTIADNTSELSGSGVRQSGGELVNTIVYGNGSGQELEITGGTQTACLTALPLPGGDAACRVGDPQFEEGGYALLPLSPAKDAGADRDWMTAAVDLAGLERVQGDHVDIGAYEVDASVVVPFTVKIEVTSSVRQPDGTSRVTLTAVYGGNKGAVRFAWKFGDAEGEAWTETDTVVVTRDYAPGAYGVVLKAYDSGDGTWADEVVATAVALPETCYVAQGEGVTPVYPYVTPETGAASLGDALGVGCAEVVVCPGFYTISESVNIGRPVVVRGQSSDPSAATVFAPAVDGLRVMNVNDPQAVVSGLTLSGGMVRNQGDRIGRAVLNLTAGVVTNCVLNGGSNYYGPSVFVSNALLVDCVIRNAEGSHSAQEATALTVGENGVADRCVITNNATGASSDSTFGEAVSLEATTAVFRNSLVAYNRGHKCGGVHILAAREFVNCTVVSNRAVVSCGGVNSNGGGNRPIVCSNNIIWGNVAPTNPNVDATGFYTFCCAQELTSGGSGNVSADPLFRNPAKGDYRLRAKSPCVNAGVNNVVPAGSLDLLGRARVAGTVVDMGCFENPGNGLLLIMR